MRLSDPQTGSNEEKVETLELQLLEDEGNINGGGNDS